MFDPAAPDYALHHRRAGTWRTGQDGQHADRPTWQRRIADAAADRNELGDQPDRGDPSARSQMRPVGLRIPMIVTELDDAGQAAWARNEAMI